MDPFWNPQVDQSETHQKIFEYNIGDKAQTHMACIFSRKGYRTIV